MAALPYFDEIDPSTVDVLLITQYVTVSFFSFFKNYICMEFVFQMSVSIAN